jgi:hypothetical protein
MKIFYIDFYSTLLHVSAVRFSHHPVDDFPSSYLKKNSVQISDELCRFHAVVYSWKMGGISKLIPKVIVRPLWN